ncbi:hypothetical protein AB0L75_02175 [Streptomyces sp. NPDC052101]|uniref:hypothetical protein n=1 Tax=Streptomyces sp. NPDC052101 TaxID=3155763 RepID=UPI0034319A83
MSSTSTTTPAPTAPDPTPAPAAGPRTVPPLRGLSGVALAALAVVGLFVWIVGASMSAPEPHDVPLAVVAPAPVAAQAAGRLSAAQPGALDVRTYTDPAGARRALEKQDVQGVLALGVHGDEVLVTGASGDAVRQLVTTVGQKAAAQGHVPLKVTDAGPLPSGDRHGLIAFTLMVALSLAGLVFQGLFALRLPTLGRWTWLAASAVFSAVAAVIAASVADLVLGAFPGRLWQVAGVAALLSFATVATVAALHRLLGMLAFPLSTLVLLQLGIATSGGPVPRAFLPSFYRALSPAMPGAAEVQAVRRLAYLHEAPVGSSLLVLTAWAAAGTLIALLAWRLRQAPAARPAS